MFVLDCGRRGKRVGLPLNLDDLFSLIFLLLCKSLLFCFVAFSDFLYLVDIRLEKMGLYERYSWHTSERFVLR